MSLTTEAVLALAPDASSAKAALGLVRPGQWPLLGASDTAVWGECQGSGAKPYQTQADLSGPAFRCTCPSRKFPCKHGLALLLLQAQQPGAFTSAEPPAWVSEWLASRVAKAEKQAEKQAEKASAPATAAPADPAAAQRREAQRWQRIEAAAQDLQRWMADQIAQGLGPLDEAGRQAWATMARRMVDAQAPGLGQRLLEAAAGLRRGDDWIEQTVRRLGLLHLACEAIGRRADLPAPEQADLRVVAGWPLDREDVLATGPCETDRWTVLGCAVEARDERLTERRVWLQGERSQRRALVLDHAFGGRGFEQAWVAGARVDATLAFYPSAAPLRALTVDATVTVGMAPGPCSSEPDEWLGVAQRIASQPWVPLHPLVLPTATVFRHGSDLRIAVQDRAWPVDLGDADAWLLLAQSGGHALDLFAEWDGARLAPLTAWSDGQLVWQRSLP